MIRARRYELTGFYIVHGDDDPESKCFNGALTLLIFFFIIKFMSPIQEENLAASAMDCGLLPGKLEIATRIQIQTQDT